MRIEIDLKDEAVEVVVVAELNELRGIICGPVWETDNREADLAAIDRVLSWYRVGN